MAKIDKFVSDRASGWEENALFREQNKEWLDRSATIALRVLRELREKSMSQKDLAKKMDVSAQYISKLVKGRENLSLDTISKLEEALDITLISVSQCAVSISVPFSSLPSSDSFVWSQFDQGKTYNDEIDWSGDKWVKMDDQPKKTA